MNSPTRLIWAGAVPLLPASFLINAAAWRNICPIATLNTLSRATGRPLSTRQAAVAIPIGIALLFLLVPARRVILDGSASITALAIGILGVAALAGGAFFDRKAGFCNSICPILPVERLYGQRPLVVVQNARCTPCEACTHGGCFDLNPVRSGLTTIGRAASDRRWVLRPFAVFALGFPGLIVGYYLSPAVDPGGTATLGEVMAVYGIVGATTLLSFLVFAAGYLISGLHPSKALVWSAGAAAGAYYWLTPGAVAVAWGLDPTAERALRLAALTLVVVWFTRAIGAARRR